MGLKRLTDGFSLVGDDIGAASRRARERGIILGPNGKDSRMDGCHTRLGVVAKCYEEAEDTRVDPYGIVLFDDGISHGYERIGKSGNIVKRDLSKSLDESSDQEEEEEEEQEEEEEEEGGGGEGGGK
uniref:Uncharacterized protein n=1 Tax=Vespula pensylvanica TaxID=30213 RepID=A0A834PFN5_VESPE|nr:hypothetical protein H0235_001230 [Vespula pensylvanica]